MFQFSITMSVDYFLLEEEYLFSEIIIFFSNNGIGILLG